MPPAGRGMLCLAAWDFVSSSLKNALAEVDTQVEQRQSERHFTIGGRWHLVVLNAAGCRGCFGGKLAVVCEARLETGRNSDGHPAGNTTRLGMSTEAQEPRWRVSNWSVENCTRAVRPIALQPSGWIAHGSQVEGRAIHRLGVRGLQSQASRGISSSTRCRLVQRAPSHAWRIGADPPIGGISADRDYSPRGHQES